MQPFLSEPLNVGLCREPTSIHYVLASRRNRQPP